MKRVTERTSNDGAQPLSTFVLKTYNILNTPENASAIAWNNDGNSFTIKNIQLLITKVLPLHFRHHKYESFIRQLNMYSFAKVKAVNGPTFANTYFRRDREDLLRFIRRKPEKKKRVAIEEWACEESQVEKLQSEVERLIYPISCKEKCLPLLQIQSGSSSPSHRTTATYCSKLVRFEGVQGGEEVQGEESCSRMIEASCKWLGRKSCWQDIRSYRSIGVSMELLEGAEEGSGQSYVLTQPAERACPDLMGGTLSHLSQ